MASLGSGIAVATAVLRRGCQSGSRRQAQSMSRMEAVFTAPQPHHHHHHHQQHRCHRRCIHSSASASASTSSYVDPTQVSHFDTLAGSWWDPYGSSRILHLMNPLRHDFIRACRASSWTPPPMAKKTTGNQQKSSSGLHYLDVGCGGGIFAESAARLTGTASVTAVDPSARVLGVARAHARRDPALAGKLTYREGSIDKAFDGVGEEGEQQQQFDVVTLFEVVEHVERPAEFLERCGRFVRPGGWLVLSTVARTWMSWLTTNFVAEDVLGMVPRGTHDWRKYINEEEMRAYFAARPGWGAPRVMGVVFVPGLGWKEVPGSEKLVNYFFAVQKDES